jgi:hypothetical protein
MPHDFIEKNDHSRQRLEALVDSLAEADYRQANSSGWTVAALLAHLAFWDQRMLALLRRWEGRGLDESPVDPDMINDALQPLCLALGPRAAAGLCLRSARETDAALAGVSPELYQAISASGVHFRFDRSAHREDHLGEIARLLGR